MSFSSDVKEEITRQEYSLSEKKAILSAIVKINGTLNMIAKGLILNLRTENAKIAKMIFLLIKELYAQDARLLVSKKAKLKKNNVYVIQIRNDVINILEDLEVYEKGEIDINPSKKLLKGENETKAYLTGCFLSSGSINDPTSKNYHLEISTHSENHAEFINKTMNKLFLSTKVIKRRNKYVIYLKKSEEISLFLRYIKASIGVLTFEDERIAKDYWNSNNRLNICEVSNEVKTMQTAAIQIKQINFILEKNKEYLLTEKQKEVMNIRLENPEANLSEISKIYEELTGVAITKSGINHRFRGIKKVYDKIKNEEAKTS